MHHGRTSHLVGVLHLRISSLMSEPNPAAEKLSLNDFLEMYKDDGMFAIATDEKTQAYVICVEDENEVIREYTHIPCDEAPVEEYMAFMIELRRLRFDYHKRCDCGCGGTMGKHESAK